MEPLTEAETRQLIQAVTRILATENVLLPPQPYDPWEWPEQLVKEYERCVLYKGFKRLPDSDLKRTFIPYNLDNTRKLGRYIHALAQALVKQQRLQPGQEEPWISALSQPLWNTLLGLRILQPAGKKLQQYTPYGIRIDAFRLYPGNEFVHRCNACGYIMSDALFNVCLRCGQQTCLVPATSISSYYRRSALQALPSSLFDDPYPLRAVEHTAQIRSKRLAMRNAGFKTSFTMINFPMIIVWTSSQ